LSSDFEKNNSRRPSSMQELVSAGMLKGVPADATGYGYVMDDEGKAQLNPQSPLAKKKKFYAKTLSNLANQH
jgi:hypothetical protein